MLTATQERKTYEDYARLPEGAPYQLIDGELIMSPSPNFRHQAIIFEISGQLRNFLRVHKFGQAVSAPMDVILDDINAYQPNLVFISEERSAIITPRGIKCAPDLVMEVLSPSTGYYDLKHKKEIYERCGVREYWIIDPIDNTVDIYFNNANRFELVFSERETGETASKVLPGFTIKLEEIFDR